MNANIRNGARSPQNRAELKAGPRFAPDREYARTLSRGFSQAGANVARIRSGPPLWPRIAQRRRKPRFCEFLVNLKPVPALARIAKIREMRVKSAIFHDFLVNLKRVPALPRIAKIRETRIKSAILREIPRIASEFEAGPRCGEDRKNSRNAGQLREFLRVSAIFCAKWKRVPDLARIAKNRILISVSLETEAFFEGKLRGPKLSKIKWESIL